MHASAQCKTVSGARLVRSARGGVAPAAHLQQRAAALERDLARARNLQHAKLAQRALHGGRLRRGAFP